MLEVAERSRYLRPDSFPPPLEGDHPLSLSVRGQAAGTITDHSTSTARGSDLTDGLEKRACDCISQTYDFHFHLIKLVCVAAFQCYFL